MAISLLCLQMVCQRGPLAPPQDPVGESFPFERHFAFGRVEDALASRASCITRGRGVWLNLPPWGTSTLFFASFPGALRDGSRLCENVHEAKDAQNCFLNCLLPTEAASTIGFYIDEIEMEILHAS